MDSVHKEILSPKREKKMRVYKGYPPILFGSQLYTHIPKLRIFLKKQNKTKQNFSNIEREREGEGESFYM